MNGRRSPGVGIFSGGGDGYGLVLWGMMMDMAIALWTDGQRRGEWLGHWEKIGG